MGKSSIRKVVSGGQTGVDRAALDAAVSLRIAHGGWCPKGRRAEDGTIDARYALRETPSQDYEERTRWNVRDSDGTLIICRGSLKGGTLFTVGEAKRTKKPLFVFDLAGGEAIGGILNWLADNSIEILNVAGPRESQSPGIYKEAYDAILKLLAD
jgi:hypothetical protein